ncbi:MAG: hypothetical protein ACXVB6_05965 [Mucilaginibacter sp.]
MSYSHLITNYTVISKELCKSDKTVALVNNVIPKAANIGTNLASGGNFVAASAASAAASAATKKYPQESAEIATTFAVAIAAEIIFPIVLVAGVGYGAYKAVEAIGNALDEFFS